MKTITLKQETMGGHQHVAVLVDMADTGERSQCGFDQATDPKHDDHCTLAGLEEPSPC